MSNPEQPAPRSNDDGLVTHVATETPEEATAFWTEERLREARPVPMPKLEANPTPADSPSADNSSDSELV